MSGGSLSPAAVKDADFGVCFSEEIFEWYQDSGNIIPANKTEKILKTQNIQMSDL